MSENWDSLAGYCVHRIWLIVGVAVIFLVIEGLYRLIWRKYVDKRKHFIEKLQDNTEGHYRDNLKDLLKEYWVQKEKEK
ncbi:MAG: hypothetical protein HXS54_17940 [Theionarchaea archaeon]|nr:hypothetical protein [Theionarchaea archaeon]